MQLYCTVILAEERGLYLAATMIACLVTLEDLVQPFKNERPELAKRSVIPYELCGVSSIVVIGPNYVGPIQLG